MTETTPDIGDPNAVKDIKVIRDALKWASCVELGDTQKQTEAREKFYQPAKDALRRIEKNFESMENAMVAMSDSLGVLAND